MIKSKKILRTGVMVVFWFLFPIQILLCIRGESNVFTYIALACYGLVIAKYVKDYIGYMETLKTYNQVFEVLESIHKERYYCYFNGTNEDVQRYSELIEKIINSIFYSSQYLLNANVASKKQKERVKTIIEKAAVLKDTIQPPV